MTLATDCFAPAILLAIHLSSLKYVTKLITAGADVNQVMFIGKTYELKSPRFNDMRNSRIHFVEFTPLEFAVQVDKYQIAEYLISQGANIYGRNDSKGFHSSLLSQITSKC
ncbi:Protein of unknown function [Cotesia congregata]|uniref:Uncharacterized protein n=1 Tax=Cotesia congregata TaxID=51543 RepID=A0A8J2H271_COTCN|nr:Protein of unknown function [Cotesia congregata]